MKLQLHCLGFRNYLRVERNSWQMVNKVNLPKLNREMKYLYQLKRSVERTFGLIHLGDLGAVVKLSRKEIEPGSDN